ncbi:hypothetical protein [Pseudomonas sp. GOM6]|uniref:hypothetical protein n=1 Tax=Pseudomonas sp. GOM6 TaxID=3036944 RepID=UPI002409D97F|nr:hypothetical protein [Pseudomonas sp. GOM6]MDG1580901.1 hypothetical protein [Pseudomonas sp. GOM6]
MNYVSKIVGKVEALRLAQICINGSIFMEVMPLPDDQYEVSVRKDQERVLFDKFLVIGRGKETRLEGGIVSALTEADAVNSVRCGRGCYVGTHNADNTLKADQVEYVDFIGEESDDDENADSGFIIRPYVVDGVVMSYIGEEWMRGDIVDTTTGAYSWVRRWISDQHVDHWKRRYSLSRLIDIWNEVVGLPLVGEKLAEPFMIFPVGASMTDVLLFLLDTCPQFISVKGKVEEDHWLRRQADADLGNSASVVCDSCENEVVEVVGSPDGAEICQDCFNAGQH